MDVISQPGESLDDEIRRTRAEKASRLGAASPTQDDPRDTASIRDNITALASRGATGGSLAAFMGTTGAVRLGKVNSDMTEDELESTLKLEQEMKAARGRWGNTDDSQAAPPKGPSLASIMTSRSKEEDDQVRERVMNRFAQPVKAATVPLVGVSQYQRANNPSSDRAKSLAEFMGSKATGPRLNKPAPQPEIERESATMAHAGSTPFAMPGMVRQRLERLEDPSSGSDNAKSEEGPVISAVSPTIPTKPFVPTMTNKTEVPAVSPTLPTKPIVSSAFSNQSQPEPSSPVKRTIATDTRHRSSPSQSSVQEPPQSPKKSVRDAIATWGTPKKDPALEERARQIKASYGVKVDASPVSSPRTSRHPSMSANSFDKPDAVQVVDPSNAAQKPAATTQTQTKSAAPAAVDNGPSAWDCSAQPPAQCSLKDGLRSDKSYMIAPKGSKTAYFWKGRRVDATVARKGAPSELVPSGTRIEEIDQGFETDDFVAALDGKVVTHQADADNGHVLYTIRSRPTGVLADQVDMNAAGLCSAFCSVLALPTEIFVWCGRFANAEDKRNARFFAKELMDGRSPTVLNEGQETDYFWHVLGGMQTASASHWRFLSSTEYDPTIFTFDNGGLTHLSRPELSTDRISLIDATFEHYLVIPSAQHARSKKADIEAALSSSHDLAERWRSRKLPFRPPVHALVFPTVIPRDLRHVMRELDFDRLNGNEKPVKMQLFTEEELREQFLS